MVRRKIHDIEVEELLMNVPSDIDTPYEDSSDEDSTDEKVRQPNVSSTSAAHDISSESKHDKSQVQLVRWDMSYIALRCAIAFPPEQRVGGKRIQCLECCD
jgi:hypothetical protein